MASFAITVHVRDKKGRPTGKTRSFETDDPIKLEEWFNLNSTLEKGRNNNKKKAKK